MDALSVIQSLASQGQPSHSKDATVRRIVVASWEGTTVRE